MVLQTTPTHQQHKHNISVVETSNKDLGMLGVFVHVLGDAINNIGVIISAVIIWKAKGHGRYYIDPAVSMFIAIMIFIPTLPLTKKSGSILLQVAPAGVDTEHVRHDMEQVSSNLSVYIWLLLIACRFLELSLSMSYISGDSTNEKLLPPLILFSVARQLKVLRKRRRLSWSVCMPMVFIQQHYNLK